MKRLAPHLALALLLALALAPAAALAHAHVQRSDPGANAVLHSSPKSVSISFSEPVVLAFTGAQITDQAGRATKTGKPELDKGGRTLKVPVTDGLKPGAYVVRWHAVSADTHRVAGKISFSVRP